MKRLITIALLLPGLLLAAPAARSETTAGVLRKGLAELNARFGELNRHVAVRARLLTRMTRYRKAIGQTRRQPAGPARDYKLRRLLAEARALAKRLSAVDARIQQAQKALGQARRKLLAGLARLKGAQKARVRRELQRTRRGRKVRVLRVAQPRIHPLDGPREILEKADVLKDSETKIRRRLAEIDRVITRLKRRRTLRSISRRVDRYTGLFNEDSSRRKVTRIRPTKITAEPSTQGGTAHDGTDGDTLGAFNGAAPADDASAEYGPGRTVSSGTYAVVLRELLTPATLQALRAAGQSGDPAARLKALKRARAELERTVKQLRSRAARYRKRAQELRVREGHPRR